MQGLSQSSRTAAHGPACCCQPGMLLRQVHFARNQPAKHCPTAAPGPRRMSTIHARRPYGTVDPMAGCALLPPVLGSCGGLSAPSNDAHRRGEQRYRRARLSGIISQQPAINACGQRLAQCKLSMHLSKPAEHTRDRQASYVGTAQCRATCCIPGGQQHH